jgi:hypothetical protein
VPSKGEHVQKADGDANFALALPLTSQPNIDWALIALFYAAMHYIEAYMATKGQHLRSHETRDKMVARDSNLRKIFKEYADLKYYGYVARYEPYQFKATDVTSSAAPQFQTLKTHIASLL